MLKITEKHGAYLTLFVDIAELTAMSECRGTHSRKWNASAGRIKRQLHEALRRGHDVQLHIHPQWNGAHINSSGDWVVDFSRHRIANLSKEEISKTIRRGKAELEAIVREVRPVYECEVFRAGGWCIQPAQDVIAVLNACGIKMDSTAVPGTRNTGKNIWFDFRRTPDQAWWQISNDICMADPIEARLIEVPIATARVPFMSRLLALFNKKLLRQNDFPCGCTGSYGSEMGYLDKARSYVSRLLTANIAKLDHSASNFKELTYVTMDKLKRGEPGDPIISISHSKNFSDFASKEYDLWLDWCAANPGLEFSTYAKWYNTRE